MDKIFLRQLEVSAVIGVWEWERRITQTVRIDLEMACDVRRAAASDTLEATLDYKAVAKRVAEFAESSQFNLVETLAEACARIIVREFEVPWVRVSIAKPAAIGGSREVGIVIERGVADFDA